MFRLQNSVSSIACSRLIWVDCGGEVSWSGFLSKEEVAESLTLSAAVREIRHLVSVFLVCPGVGVKSCPFGLQNEHFQRREYSIAD